MTSAHLRRLRGMAAWLFCALTCTGASAQGVHKCMVDGKVTYQAEDCKSGGKTLNLPARSQEDEKAAMKRRFDEHNRQYEMQSEFDSRKRMEIYNTPRAQAKAPPDCATLNKELGDAYGQRNGMISGMRGQSDGGQMKEINDKNMAGIQSRINSASQAMNQAGCKMQ